MGLGNACCRLTEAGSTQQDPAGHSEGYSTQGEDVGGSGQGLLRSCFFGKLSSSLSCFDIRKQVQRENVYRASRAARVKVTGEAAPGETPH